MKLIRAYASSYIKKNRLAFYVFVTLTFFIYLFIPFTTASAATAPTNLNGIAVSSRQINLTWSYSNPGGDSIQYYEIWRKTGTSGTWSLIGYQYNPYNFSYNDTTLSSSTSYYYEVRAYYSGKSCPFWWCAWTSGYTGYSNIANTWTLPLNPPQITALAVTSSDISLSWFWSESFHPDLILERATGEGQFGQILVMPAFSGNFSDIGLTQNTVYNYRVRAYDGLNYSAYSYATAETAILYAPSNLVAATTSPTQIDLTWTDNSSDEVGFAIERKTEVGGTYSQIATTASNVTSYQDSGLTTGFTYYYRIRSFNAPNYSSYSNEASAAAINLPPTGSIAINNGALFTNTVSVALTLNASDADGVSQMQFSNDGSNWSTAEAYATTKAWTLTTGDGAKTVSAKFMDSAGNWSNVCSTCTATIIVDTIAPTVNISSPASITTRENTPLLSYTVADANPISSEVVSVDGTIVSKTSGSYLDILSDGTHTVRVDATDSAGNNSFGQVGFVVNSSAPMTISGVASSTNTIDTASAEQATIFYSINSHATVTFKIVPEKLGPTGAPIYQTSQNCVGAGAYLFTWDGKDSTGKVVPDEAYLYILEATDGTVTASYSPAAPTGTGTISCSQSGTYNPFYNESVTISYEPGQPAKVNLYMTYSQWPNKTVNIVSNLPQLGGMHSLIWDGRNPSGTPAPAGGTVACSVASLLSENIILTNGVTPQITDVKTDPYAIDVSYGQVTAIKYNLSRGADVTVQLVSPSGATTTLVNATPQSAGPNDVKWSNFDVGDSTYVVKTLSTYEPGFYTVLITATNTAAGISPPPTATARASLEIGL